MSKSRCANKIPVTWQSVCLSDIFYDPQNDIVSGPFGSNLKTSDYTNDGVPILRIQNIKRNELVNKNIKYTSRNKADQLDRHNYKKGDIVITKLGDPVGKVCIIPDNMDDGIIIADLVRARLNHSLVSKKFIVYQLNSERVIQQFKAKTKGTTRPRVSLNQVRELNIVLPSLNEQHRIVSKIEELFSELDYAERELKKAQRQLEKYRQALLKSAFHGELTQKKVKKGELPKGWKQVKFNDFCELQRGYDLPLSKIVSGEYPVVTSSGINGYHNKYKAKGPCLITGRSGNVGNVYYVDIDYYWPHNTVLFVKDFRNNLPKYIYYYFLQFDFKSYSSSTAVPTLDRKQLYNEIVPVPTLLEQEQIVQELETKFSLIENLENTIKTNLHKIEGFRYVVLKKAFKGELVPKNPDDEDASKLLQKIQEEKEDYLNAQKKVQKKKPKGRLLMKKDKSIMEILKEVDSSIEAEELWLQSKHEKDIEAFYAELKKIETEINIETKGKKSLIGLKR
jgi:type I restriction enzyme S subunit